MLERLGRIFKTKSFFNYVYIYIYFFFDVSTQIGYFNIGFVSLRFKNTTQILIHFDKNMQEKSTIFLKIF